MARTLHQHPILLRPVIDEGRIRLPIKDAPAKHRLPERLGDLTGWYISEDGRELVIHDGSVEPDDPFNDMVSALAGVLPDMHLVSYDEDQNIKFALSRGLITEVVCANGQGTVTIVPIQEFVRRARFLETESSQGFEPRLQLLLELASRPEACRSLVAWCEEGVEFQLSLKLSGGPPAIEHLFHTGWLLQLIAQLEEVGGDARKVAMLRGRATAEHDRAFDKLLAVLATLVSSDVRPDPDAESVSRLVGEASFLPPILARIGPGAYPGGVVLWPGSRVLASGPADPPLVQIGTLDESPLYLDTRFEPRPVVYREADALFEVDDDLPSLLASGTDVSLWR
ncbi:MAG: hypothetical protein KF894_00480 [Labilithrix sp.]|nr:hypothetical protein [Labilithrix sp.]